VVFFYDWYGSGRTSLLPVLVMVALKISCPFLQQPNADSVFLIASEVDAMNYLSDLSFTSGHAEWGAYFSITWVM
jgi:hypothetical protein